ncbi:MAG: hypothetical protein R3B84_18230 [Zavarzinella sp.]
MKLKRFFAASVVSASFVFGSQAISLAEEPMTEYTFGTLRATPDVVAAAKAEEWLKKTGVAYDAKKFNEIWANSEVTVLDRVLDTLALGSPEAKQAIEIAANAANTAPKEVPAILKDEKQDSFLRANLAIGFARGCTDGRVYEESLEALSLVKAEQTVDPAAYFFHRAVAEHALIKKDQALRSIVSLLDDVANSPERYRMLSAMMLVDIGSWSSDPKDLSNIKRLMDNSERRLGQARAGKVTQDIQKKIVFRLDELIKEKENQSGGGGGEGSGGGKPDGGAGSGTGPGTLNPSSPANESRIMQGSGQGKVDPKALKALQDKWGTMPQRERERAIQDLTKDLPPNFKTVIEDYFRALSNK